MQEKQNDKPKKVSDLMRERREKPPIDISGQILKIMEDRPISYSSGKNFLKSPWHFFNYYIEPKEKKDYFDTGTLFEMMLLEPEKVDDEIVISPVFNKRTKDGKAEYEKFLADNRGKTVISEDVLQSSLDMYERAIKDPEVKDWLSRLGWVQEKVYYTHPPTKLRAMSKIDARTSLDDVYPAIVDLKTTARLADPNDFTRTMYSLDYWLQAGSYCYAYQKKHFVYPEYYWMVFETKPPYAFNIIKAEPSLIEEGIRVWDNLLKGIKFCIDEDLWHVNHKFWRLMMPYDSVKMPGYHKPRV